MHSWLYLFSVSQINSNYVSAYFEENVDLHQFDWETIAAATNKFSRSNNIGICGLGNVYKVVFARLTSKSQSLP